jgi:integrase
VKETDPSPSASKKAWQKTQYSNLVRYAPSGTYYARFRVRGKLIWKSLKTDRITVAKLRLSDLEKAERGAAEQESEVRRGKMSFGDALAEFMAGIEAKPSLKPRTKAYYSERVDALKKSWPELEKTDARQITKADCRGWAGRFAAQSSPVAFNHTASVLRRAFDVAVELGARYDNPAASIEWMKERPKKLRLPEPGQFEHLLREIENCGWVNARQSADMVRFLAYGGFRKTEAINILWRDCDFPNGCIAVKGDPEAGTKNGEERRVPMIPEMRQLLARLRETDPLPRADSPVIAFKDCRKALAGACGKLGIPRLTHHDLRHLFATRCIESGVDIPTVSRWLGHKDGGALAMRVYGHLRDHHSTEMAKKVTFGTAKAQGEPPPGNEAAQGN